MSDLTDREVYSVTATILESDWLLWSSSSSSDLPPEILNLPPFSNSPTPTANQIKGNESEIYLPPLSRPITE